MKNTIYKVFPILFILFNIWIGQAQYREYTPAAKIPPCGDYSGPCTNIEVRCSCSDYDALVALDQRIRREGAAAYDAIINSERSLMKEAIEKILNKKFPSYSAAKTALLNNHVVRHKLSPSNAIQRLKNSSNEQSRARAKATTEMASEVSVLDVRISEIRNGNISNSELGGMKINGVFLRDLTDISELNSLRGATKTDLKKYVNTENANYHFIQGLNGLDVEAYNKRLVDQMRNQSNSADAINEIRMMNLFIHNVTKSNFLVWTAIDRNNKGLPQIRPDFEKIRKEIISKANEEVFKNKPNRLSGEFGNTIGNVGNHSDSGIYLDPPTIPKLLAIRNHALNELDNIKSDPKWNFSEKGVFNGTQDLKYVATTTGGLDSGEKMFLLANGSILFRTQNQKVINPNDANTIASSEIPIDGNYHYLYNTELEEWFEFLLPPKDISDASLDFLFDAFWSESPKLIGRYVLPVEDVLIMFTGRDFDGLEANRTLATGMILVSIVPGGKFLKILKGNKVIQVAIKNADEIASVAVRYGAKVPKNIFDKITNSMSCCAGNLNWAIENGDYLADVVIEASEEVADIAAKKGRKLSWDEIKALFKRGNDFNKKARTIYEYNEINLKSGKRLDSYIPGKEIISRKATTLKDIKVATFEGYLKELTTKYKIGTKIRSNKYSKPPFNIDGQTLQGEYFLEIPSFNKAYLEGSKTLMDLLKKYKVKIKYLDE